MHDARCMAVPGMLAEAAGAVWSSSSEVCCSKEVGGKGQVAVSRYKRLRGQWSY